MKKRSLVSLLLASAFAVSLLAACNKDDDNNKNDNPDSNPPAPTQPVQLSAPNITLSENVISWSAVDNATGYDVYEGATVVSTAQTALSYTINKTEAGEYTYTVKAVSTDENYTASNASNSVKYTVSQKVELSQTKVYVVGDSTGCAFNDTSYYMPRYGYGTQLSEYFDSKAEVINLASSGKSSYNFLQESNYSTLENSIGEGDYLLIGFGHNDEKLEVARYTNPNLPYTDSTTLINERPASFAYTLYTHYIKLAIDKGATPILCTPIVRYNANNNYNGSSAHITENKNGYAGGDYAQAIRDLGKAVDVDVIDLTEITKADYTALGADAVKYHAYPTAKWTDSTKTQMVGVSADNTHTNKYGARMNAYHIAFALKDTQNSLAAYVKPDIAKPDNSVYTESINTSYIPSDYESFNPAKDKSALWTSITADGWYGTAFGTLGGNKADTFTVTQNSENSFTVGNTGNNGKIKDTDGDGFAAVFRKLSVLSNFEITAKVTLDQYAAVSQSGFGIMLRDDIKIDVNEATFANYVAAGCYLNGSNVKTNFTRTNEKTLTANGTATLRQGGEYTLSITKVANGITVNFNGQTAHYDDFELSKIDGSCMYLCLFATRGTIVTFSDVVFIDNGETEA